MKKVTDPYLLQQLNAAPLKKVTDPQLLQQLDADDSFGNQQESEKTGFSGIASDVGQSIAGLPSSLLEALKSLPGEAYGAVKQLGQPKRFGQNVLAGLGELGHGLINTPANVADYLGRKNIISKEHAEAIPRQRETDYFEAVGGEGQQPGDALIRGAVSYAPFGVAGELGALRSGLKGLASRGAQRAGAAGAYGVSQNQDPLKAALLQAALGATGKGIAKATGAPNALRPSRLLRGELSPEELSANLRATKGTNTPLGDVIQSPGLKKLFENAAVETPFSGGMKKLSEIKKQVGQRAEDTLSNLGKNIPEGDTNSLTKKMLDSVRGEHKKRKNALYNEVTNIADAEGHQVALPTFSKLASDTSNSIEESPLLKNDPDFKRAYEKLAGFKEGTRNSNGIVDASGNTLASSATGPSITEAKLIGNKLHDEGQKLSNSIGAADRSLGNLYLKLAKNIRDDVRNGIDTRGSEKLKAAYESAETNFKQNFSQFLDKDIYKLFQQDKDPQAIVREIIRPGKQKDLYTRIEKVQKLLPEKQQNLLGYSFLKSGAENKNGVLQPKKVAQLIDSLGNRQFNALFPNEKTRQSLLDYGKLRGLNEEALNVMFNAKTGARGVGNALKIAEGFLAGGGLFTGHPLAALASVAVPAIGARAFNSWVTSPAVRESLVNKMMKVPIKKSTSTKGNYAAALARAMTPAQMQQEKKPMELLLTQARGK